MKPNLFLTRKLPQPAMDRIHELFDAEVNPYDRVLTKKEVLEGIKGKDALLCLLTDPIDKEIISVEPNLKVISNYAVGYNNIDVPEATALGIPVCYTPGVLTETTADLAWALILAVARKIVPSDLYTRQHQFKGWGPELFLGNDVHGKTLGIVGMGRIGMATARRAAGFNMKVLYTKRREAVDDKELPGAEKVELQDLLIRADFVSIHIPFNPETKHLVGERELRLMKSSSYLINTARGPIVDEDALVKALEQKTIAGAGLDVYENEPEIHPGLIALDNVVLLPHTGSATLETRGQMGIMAAENAHAVVVGKKPHAIINPQTLKQ
ncbi:D-glycerate dehydrogenase [Simkania negevensis]|uniref:D-glycerate dehydrogenase n=1 Tax=Simkania negevensis TaxID=83561 RepID=A0ABS3APM6_9BACT|nr:D-glycerate dehydrogenase [Simkania negevensis]